MLIEVMTPLITSQLKNADHVLVSKCDLATDKQIEFSHKLSREYNSDAAVSNYSPDTPLEDLLKEIAPWMI